ncbi:uncharacterized protein TRUGW13939_00958 [Talaromyces rugulosus]|uniref:Uncharacterized protein n=1 Tax=Talaromyces rugulosus TaxID=121627 RepID=A0A7H8QIU5_TALRU|nr:uncharacterized protein TRUGW13939_00958 [Talaromyces rugulosus]QKX53878.1 hypothetical protein TRUGW13939_00958 [Talaromyces rugulosus]
MATLLYLMMRPLWNGQKRKVAQPGYTCKYDAEDYTNDSFSDYFDDKQHEEKSQQHNKTGKDEQGRDRDDIQQDSQQNSQDAQGAQDDSQDDDQEDTQQVAQVAQQDAQHDAQQDTEIVDDDCVEITISISLRGKGYIPTEHTHQVCLIPRPIIEPTQASVCAAVMDTTNIESTETLLEFEGEDPSRSQLERALSHG